MNRQPLRFLDATHVHFNGRELLYFGGGNYLGLSWHPAVRRACAKAARAGPLQTGASRATTGEHFAYRHLELRLARYFRVEDAAYVGTGYLAPIAATHVLRESITHVLLDDRAHACVVDAALVSGRTPIPFRHGDARDLRSRLKAISARAIPLVACDGTFGTRGGCSPLDAYLGALPRHGWLLVDDAHGAGAVGPVGRGVCAMFGLNDPRIIQTISLAKAFGVSGGAVLGGENFIARLRSKAEGFVGSTSPLLPAVAALDAALGVLEKSRRLVDRLQTNARRLHEELHRQTIPSRAPANAEIISDPRTPVVGFYPTTPARAEKLRRALLRDGIFPPFIRYPGGPASGFFRFAVMAQHRQAEIQQLARTIRLLLEDAV